MSLFLLQLSKYNTYQIITNLLPVASEILYFWLCYERRSFSVLAKVQEGSQTAFILKIMIREVLGMIFFQTHHNMAIGPNDHAKVIADTGGIHP